MKTLSRAIFLVLAVACVRPPAHTVLTVTDPLGLATDATALDILVGERAPRRVALGSESFPVTLTVSGPDGGSLELLTVEAVADDTPVARGRVMAAFPPKKSGSATVELAAVCGPDAVRGLRCTFADGSGFGVCSGNECVPTSCGDGVVDAEQNEECDDGNDSGADACTPACKVNVCGDGYANPASEECDDGNQVETDTCTNTCERNICGDGVQLIGVEACDDGNDVLTDDCVACELATCGDGVRRLDITNAGDPSYEACDDGNANPNDTCHACAFTSWQAEIVIGFDAPSLVRLAKPLSVAWNPLGGLVVIDDVALATYDPIGNRVTTLANDLAFTPHAVAVDDTGTLLVADAIDDKIWQVRPSDRPPALPFAGGGSAPSPADSEDALGASFSAPSGVAAAGDELAVADTGNHLIRWISGSVVTIVGGQKGTAGNDLLHLDAPHGVAVDVDGTIVVADTSNGRILRTVFPFYPPFFNSSSDENFEVLDSSMNEPYDVVIDGDRVFVADHADHVIRVIDLDPTPTVSVYAGTGAAGYAGDGGAADSAQLESPQSLALGGGYLWIVEGPINGTRVRRVDLSDDTIATVGNDDLDFIESRPALGLPLVEPHGVAMDGSGNLLISDAALHRVFRVNGDGSSTVVVGDGPLSLPDDTAAELDTPRGIDVDSAGNLYIADEARGAVYEVSSAGVVTTAASGLSGPRDVAVIAEDHFYVADYGNSIVKEVNGGVTDLAETSGTSPTALAIGGTDLYIADESQDVWKLPSGGVIESIVTAADRVLGLAVSGTDLYFVDAAGRVSHLDLTGGSPTVIAYGTSDDVAGDGAAIAGASLRTPAHLLADGAGGLYVADAGEGRVRLLDLDGNASSVAGELHPGDGLLADARLAKPQALAYNAGTSSWWIADGGRVRSLSESRLDTRVGYPRGLLDATAIDASLARLFDQAGGIAVDEDAVYVSETNRHVIRKVTLVDPGDPSTWTVENFAGLEDAPGWADGTLTEARFHSPMGLAADSGRDLLIVADRDNHVIRRINLLDATIETTAGTPGVEGFEGDGGPATEAQLKEPVAIAIAGDSGCYIADSRDHRVRHVDPSTGIIQTVIGTGSAGSEGDGAGASSLAVDAPAGLAVDSFGNLYVSSRVAVRQVTAGPDGVAGPNDRVVTIYGALPRDTFPENATLCLTGVGVDPATDEVMITDSCQGVALRLRSVTN